MNGYIQILDLTLVSFATKPLRKETKWSFILGCTRVSGLMSAKSVEKDSAKVEI